MIYLRHGLACVAFVTALMLPGAASAAIDPEDQKLINAATCPELIEEHGNYLKAERELAAEIQRSKSSNTMVNVAGIAAFAALGVGFFSWDDTSSAEENLAELREYRAAMAQAAKRKKCKL